MTGFSVSGLLDCRDNTVSMLSEDKNTGDVPCAPILLVGFNRPDFMAAQIEAIRAAQPGKVYIAVDGPRDGRADEAEKCRAVRDCATTIDWSCEVKTLFREKNLGCKHAVSGAITWLFENEEAGIVLEDDCRPTVDFLRFASEMLWRYREDGRIGAVCGFNHFNLQTDSAPSYHFSRHMDIWGWASWRRVWKEYDVEMSSFAGRLPEIIDKAPVESSYKRVLKVFVNDLRNGLSTWDIQFTFLSLVRGYMNVVPRTRLVANAGLADDRATHTGGYIYWGKDWSKAGKLDFPLVHPHDVVCDEEADRLRERMEGAIFPRGLTWMGAKFPCLCGLMTFIGKIAEKVSPFLFRL